jgi:radical SAM superfamily enzyme YgiQ (UPF0313 family)
LTSPDAVAGGEVSTAPILGGAGFSIHPGAILEYLGASMGIQGEGETAFPELLKRLQTGQSIDALPGLFQQGKPAPARRTFAGDLDALPLPDPSLLAGSLTGFSMRRFRQSRRPPCVLQHTNTHHRRKIRALALPGIRCGLYQAMGRCRVPAFLFCG